MIFKVPCCQKENSKFDKQQDRLNQVGKEAESRFAFGRGGKHDYHMQLQMTKGSSVKLEVLMRMIVIGWSKKSGAENSERHGTQLSN